MSDEPNENIQVGVAFNLDGVHFFLHNPVTNQPQRVFRVEPEFARRIAESLTLRSFECEDARREAQGKSSGG